MRHNGGALRAAIHRRATRLGLAQADEEGLAAFCIAAVARFRPQLILLHGSTAMGGRMPWSDLDVLVIADFSQPFLRRLQQLFALIPYGARVEPVGYTPREFTAQLQALNPLILDAVGFGVPLLDNGLYRRARTLTRLHQRGLRRTPNAYVFESPVRSQVIST